MPDLALVTHCTTCQYCNSSVLYHHCLIFTQVNWACIVTSSDGWIADVDGAYIDLLPLTALHYHH